jgi:hypothetical protein
MNAKIKTTGDLREFLAKAMVDVQSGELNLDKAARITKLAGQINESFYAEVKVAKTRTEAGSVMPNLGELTIGAN